MQKDDVEEQGERLSRKHIQTLAFLQGVVKENNTLKAKIAEYDEQKLHCEELHAALDEAQAKLKHLHEQGSKRTDDVSAVLVQQHQKELGRLADEKATLERYWERMSKDMRLEIERLEKENAKQSDSIASLERSFRSERQAAADRARLAAEDAVSLGAQLEHLASTNRRQAEELARAAGDRDQQQRASALGLAEAAQRVKELELRNAELLRSANHSASCHEEALKEADAARAQMRKASKERGALAERAASLGAELSAAEGEARRLRDELAASEGERGHLLAELERLREESLQEQRKLASSAAAQPKEAKSAPSSFRDFVEMKRELAATREENALLKERLVAKPKALPGIRLSRPNSSDSRAT